MTTFSKPYLQQPVSSPAELRAFLAAGGRPASSWGVGPEIEKLVVDAETGEAAPFSRVEALLVELEAAGGWRGGREEGHLIAVIGPTSSITPEPGGQLELSGGLAPHVHCCPGGPHPNAVAKFRFEQ